MEFGITEADIFEEKEELMVSPTGGIPCKRIARFLKPVVSAGQDSGLKMPFLSPKSRWPMDVAFNGWLAPLQKWSKWVDEMHSKHSDLWRKTGILEAILASKYKFHRVDDLFYGVAERWNSDTNTFVFPWGEVTITLEDMMILGGFSVLGVPVISPLEDTDMDKIRTTLDEVLITRKKQTQIQWLNFFRNQGRKYEHEAFLSLWLSMFVFPGTEIERVGDEVFPIAVHLARGTKIALAPAILASIYRDLSVLKVSMATSTRMEAEEGTSYHLSVSLWAPLQLVQLWVWERFLPFRPEPNALKPGEPRVARWHDVTRFDIGNVRPIISSSGEFFLWRPYCLAIDNWPFPKFYNGNKEWTSIEVGQDLESLVRCLRSCVLVGLDCREVYNPHRVAMQFGFDQDIPGWIPCSNSSFEAWFDYSKPFGIEAKVEVPPRLAESDVSSRYLDWWRKDVLTPPVESFQGLARKKRSSRLARKHIPCDKDIEMEYPVSNDENLGCESKSDEIAPCESSPLSSHNQIEPQQKDINIPPGFPLRAENGRMESFAKLNVNIEPADMDVPPGFAPIAKDTDGSTQVSSSKLQTTEVLQHRGSKVAAEAKDSSDCQGFPLRTENGKMEKFGKLNVKIEPADLDVPPGFAPKAKVTEGSPQVSSSKLQTTEILHSGSTEAPEAKDSSACHSEATLPLSTSTMRASGSLRSPSNSCWKFGPERLIELEDRLDRIDAFLFELQKGKIKPIMKCAGQNLMA